MIETLQCWEAFCHECGRESSAEIERYADSPHEAQNAIFETCATHRTETRQVTCYRPVCDRCGCAEDFGDHSHIGPDLDCMWECADENWRTINARHLCPECWTFDEITDEEMERES